MAPPKHSVRNTIIICIIAVLCLIVIAASFRDAGFIKQIRSGTIDFFKPIQEKIFVVFQPVAKFSNNIKNLFTLSEKIKQLELENANLINDYSENINLRLENNSLRSLLEIKQREDYETVAAKVIGFNSGKWQSEITINAGKNSGILEGMGVINEKGFVGIVILSSSNSSKVRLLNDPQISIGARVLSSRILGMIEGSPEKKVMFNFIAKDEIIYPGDIVMTSEFGKYIPPEILLGVVKKVSFSESDPFKIIEIMPFNDSRALETVLVITGW